MLNPLPYASLDPLFRPRSVAIVGASNDPNKIGGRPLAFLKRGGFTGAIYPINPSAREVQSLRAYPDLAQVPAEYTIRRVWLRACRAGLTAAISR